MTNDGYSSLRSHRSHVCIADYFKILELESKPQPSQMAEGQGNYQLDGNLEDFGPSGEEC